MNRINSEEVLHRLLPNRQTVPPRHQTVNEVGGGGSVTSSNRYIDNGDEDGHPPADQPPRKQAKPSHAPRRLHVARGQTKPANTVLVCRPYRYGNPFDWQHHGRAQAVALHAAWITDPASTPITLGKVTYRPVTAEQIRAELGGKNLACRCPDDGQPCHGDTLLRIANEAVTA